MNKVFAEHVTSTAFFLSMSMRQIEALSHIHNKPWRAEDATNDRGYYATGTAFWENRQWISTCSSLARKGLIERHTYTFKDRHPYKDGATITYWKTSRAGELVFELLKEAGLVKIPMEKAA